MRKFSRFDETRRARWSRLIFSMCAWLSNRANWVWQRVAFAELCQDFIPSYKVSTSCSTSIFRFLLNEKAIQQYWNCLVLKNLICQTQISNVDRQNFELDLSDTNQQHGSTDSIQTTSGIAQIFQNPVKNKKGADVK